VTSPAETQPTPQRRAGRSRSARLQAWVWNRRAAGYHHGTAAALGPVVRAVLAQADAGPGADAVDLGCGLGALAVPLVERGARVLAVDVSEEMIGRLEADAAARGPGRLETRVQAIEDLRLPPGSLDLVVSCYALHHLSDDDKLRVVREAARWLRPGGRLVVGDMMFGRGASARDRSIIAGKATVMLRRGPAGWWRLLKNVVRFTARIQERPVSMETWVGYFEAAGLVSVTSQEVVAEAAVVTGTRA
jgi:SAM-dependent methyltransferase